MHNDMDLKPVLDDALEIEDCQLEIRIQPIRTKWIKIKIICDWLNH